MINNYEQTISYVMIDKERPAFIYYVNGNYALVLKITTKFKNKSEYMKRFYYKMIDWKKSGLKEQSYIDTFDNYLIDLTKTNVEYKGKLTKREKINFIKFIKENKDIDFNIKIR